MFNTIFAKKKNNNDIKNRILSIPINLIKPNSYQPRKNFDKNSLEDLCESIKMYGLLQPITIREMPGGYYELITGERRLRACKIIGMKEISSILIEINDSDSAIIALTENIQREQLHFFEEAQGYYNLLYKHNLSQNDLGKILGKNQSAISNKLKLLRLSPIVRKIIINKNLSEGHAKALLRLDSEDMQFKILKIIYEKELNLKETEELINSSLNKEVKKEDNSNKGLIGCCRDIRIFINTINQAIKMMNKSGVNIKSTQNDNGDMIEFMIQVKKS